MLDTLGNPFHIQLSSVDIYDLIIVEDIPDHIDMKWKATTMLIDKAFGSFDFREYITNRNTDYYVPPKSSTIDPRYYNWVLYKERSSVECFNKN